MAAERYLIVGLGNPGPEYSHNRHNVGYWCVNRLARLHGVPLKAHPLATFGEGSVAGVAVVLAKPRTFVNRSGQAVAPLLRKFHIDTRRLLVVCDELDLPVGKLRLKAGGSYGGHNGLRSIIGALGRSDFPRIRIGIGRPVVEGEPTWAPDEVAPYVLGDPTAAEAEALQAAVIEAVDAVKAVLKHGVDVAMNRYNR